MPIYEYECGLCHFQFERKQRFDDEPIAMCPKCDGKAHRVLHAVPIIFKGSGFYVTDNRKGSATEPVKGKKKSPGERKSERGSVGEGTTTASH